MPNTSQNMNKDQDRNKNQNSKESRDKLNRKIKETWPNLGDSDIKLYDGKPDEFFAKVKDKQHVSIEEAQTKMQQLEKDCGCSSATKAA